jgi:para-aminobenzoate synthetase/4-amino-4-deoxychorismate lyase
VNAACYALLDDASSPEDGQARSRLYTGYIATLRCTEAQAWPDTLARLQEALARGQHAVALLSYELGGHLHSIAARDDGQPLAEFLLFGELALLDHAGVEAWLAASAAPEEAQAQAAQDAEGTRPAGVAAVRRCTSEEVFDRDIERIRAYIAAGDTYQVNYTMRIACEAFGELPALYGRLRARQPVPYGALIALPDGRAVLSLSPELFVRHEGGMLTTRPMKGTAPAGADASADARIAGQLRQDPKNRAENLMIVDLLRNDLGRIAATGAVDVPALFDVQRFGDVLQMTSTIRARPRPGLTLDALFAALYPCGSITGAPKRRTMEIIRELERDARGLYTGAIGWFAPVPAPHALGEFCLSVPIRTLQLEAPRRGVRQAVLGVGAGIVYDSRAGDEYFECQLKARFLTGLPNEFELFETMLAQRDGCRHRDRHLDRLGASARYFGFAFDRKLACALLDQSCAALPDAQAWRLRLSLRQDGALDVQTGKLAPLDQPVGVLLASAPTQADDLFLRHKTSVRTRYDAAWRAAEARGAFDTLFFNEQGQLTEGGRSNVFVKLHGEWLTPPLECGLLPGVMRQLILDDPRWKARCAIITRDQLMQSEQLMVCNSLRGAVPVRLMGSL